jgi:hypothetical protein
MGLKIIRIEQSPLKNKRLRVILEDGSYIDFGLKDSSTYIDHKDPEIRYRYWARHYANKTEKHLIQNFIPSPSVMSAYILWGAYDNIKDNINNLNKFL